MTWNYRIIKYPDENGYGLHEVYYNEDGSPDTMTKDPIDFVCESEEGPEGIIRDLEMALADAKKSPVFDPPKEWND